MVLTNAEQILKGATDGLESRIGDYAETFDSAYDLGYTIGSVIVPVVVTFVIAGAIVALA